MASSPEYLRFILEQLPDGGRISHRAMMGEYLLYDGGKLFGGIYDDRLLVKPIPAAAAYLKTVTYELPYEGAKPMLAVDNVDDREYLAGLIDVMFPALPAPKKKRG